MPELPEVEDAARRLREIAVGQTISTAQALHPRMARTLTDAAGRRVRGRKIMSVARRAKVQLVRLDDGSTLTVHLGMTGDWSFGIEADPAPAYERARITLTNGHRMSFVDVRVFGLIAWHPPGAMLCTEYGPEPLEPSFTAHVLHDMLGTRRGPIKPVLLDQRVVAGLGNIYAAEALWVARIRPDAVANRLSRARVARLRDAIVQVLLDATGSRYRGSDGNVLAEQARSWHVYDRAGEPCSRCRTAVTRMVQAGRSTFCCRRCQR